MGNQFYYTNTANEVLGPCTTLQLMALHKAGTLKESSLVCAEGSEEWVELKTIFPAARLTKLNKASSKPPEASVDDAEGAPGATTAGAETSKGGTPLPATWNQAAILISLLVLGLALPYLDGLRPVPKWEYKKVTFPSEGQDRIGPEALKYSSIKIDEGLLNQMGRDGWEIIGSHLEMETAFASFGNGNALSGLQPNVRPQSLTILFKRPARGVSAR